MASFRVLRIKYFKVLCNLIFLLFSLFFFCSLLLLSLTIYVNASKVLTYESFSVWFSYATIHGVKKIMVLISALSFHCIQCFPFKHYCFWLVDEARQTEPFFTLSRSIWLILFLALSKVIAPWLYTSYNKGWLCFYTVHYYF